MTILSLIFFTCLTLEGAIAAPTMDSDYFDETYSPRIDKEDDHKINLDHLGSRMYGLPSREAGQRVENWRKGDKVNPEELGGYAEGDILSTGGLKMGLPSSSRWPNKTIPYIISGKGFDEDDRAMIQSAIDDIHHHTCVRFVPRTNERAHIRITSKFGGCYSSVGYIGQSYDVNLQPGGCTSLKGTVLHELMHAMGFVHEHSRAERDDYVTIYKDNIEEDAKCNFQKYKLHQMNHYNTSYDYTSVMHYSRYAFHKNGEQTIVPKDPEVLEMGQRDRLSPGDILKINRRYECDETSTANVNSMTTRINRRKILPNRIAQSIYIQRKTRRGYYCQIDYIPNYPQTY